MSLNFSKWIDKYECKFCDESIEYRDSSGALQEDTDCKFGEISTEFQQRGHIFRNELRNIGEWKVPSGRIDHHLKENNPTHVEQRSAVAFQTNADEEKIEALIELQGVRVPVASAILTMADPANYAVIDYRSFRALGAADPQLLDTQTYSNYVEFMDSFENYNSDPQAYSFYMDEIRRIANNEGRIPREVDMALWAFDEANSP